MGLATEYSEHAFESECMENDTIGALELDLDVQGNKLVARDKTWIPAARH
jgi:hypothetical protein